MTFAHADECAETRRSGRRITANPSHAKEVGAVKKKEYEELRLLAQKSWNDADAPIQRPVDDQELLDPRALVKVSEVRALQAGLMRALAEVPVEE